MRIVLARYVNTGCGARPAATNARMRRCGLRVVEQSGLGLDDHQSRPVSLGLAAAHAQAKVFERGLRAHARGHPVDGGGVLIVIERHQQRC